jgi:hypothetical protein
MAKFVISNRITMTVRGGTDVLYYSRKVASLWTDDLDLATSWKTKAAAQKRLDVIRRQHMESWKLSPSRDKPALEHLTKTLEAKFSLVDLEP